MKIKLTKNELKKQKDALKSFTRYLPTLMLKKQQLQLEIVKIQNAREELEKQIIDLEKNIFQWVDVFNEDAGLKDILTVKKIETDIGNIAGIDIPVFKGITFQEKEYDLFLTPLWLDYGLEAVKDKVRLKTQFDILDEQLRLVKEELRITTQRVNLFEKVKIPEAKENIRRIRIFLGDMQTAAVVTGKIAKTKIERKLKLQAAYDS